MGTGFYGSNDPTNSVKALKEDRSKDPETYWQVITLTIVKAVAHDRMIYNKNKLFSSALCHLKIKYNRFIGSPYYMPVFLASYIHF